MPLSAGKVEYFAAAFFLRNPPAGGLAADELLIRRERFVTDDLQEHIVVTNLTGDAVTVELTVELASDFADILSIKHHDFALGDPGLADALPPPVDAAAAGRRPRRRACSTPEGELSTEVRSSRAALVSGSALCVRARARPHAEWDVRLTFRPRHRARATGAHPSRAPLRRAAGPHPALAERLEHARAAAARVVARARPGLRALGLGPRGAAHARQRRRRPAARCGHAVVHDGVRARHDHHVPADARLRARARAHGPARAGRAAGRARRSRHRRGAWQDHPRAAPRASRRGLVPALLRHASTATPLFLVLLSETWRWTADDALVRELEPAMRMALRWIDESGDLRRRRLRGVSAPLGSRPRGAVVEGLPRLAALRRRPRSPQGAVASSEVQGYVYDAKLRCAELARAVLGDALLAERLEREARRAARALRPRLLGRAQRRASTHSRWTATSSPVDSRCSNMGHLLWSGIVPDARVADVARTLLERAALVGLGRAHDVGRGRGLPAARVPQRHGLAARQFADRPRPLAARRERRRAAHPAQHARGGALLRRRSARGIRRAAAPRHAVPGRVSDGLASAGLGGRRAGAAPAGAARARARSARADACRALRSACPDGPEA